MSAQRETPITDALIAKHCAHPHCAWGYCYTLWKPTRLGYAQITELIEHTKRMERERADLVKALTELVKAEAEYGDQSNVAINQAWLPAQLLLDRFALLARIETEK